MPSSRRSSRDDVLADIDQEKGYPEIAVEQIRQLALIILDDMKAVDEPQRMIWFFSISAEVLLEMERGSPCPDRVGGPGLRS